MPDWIFKADAPGKVPAGEFMKAIRDKEPIRALYAIIEGDVDLRQIDYPHPLAVRGCYFNGHLNLGESTFAKSVDFSGCIFGQSLTFAGAHFKGYLRLHNATIQKGTSGMEVANFDQMHVGGSFEASGLDCELRLHLDRARIDGRCSIYSTSRQRTHLRGGITLVAARLFGPLDLRGALIDGDLTLTNTELHGDLKCCPDEAGQRVEVAGITLLRAANIVGEVDFNGALLKGGVAGQDLQVAEGVYFSVAAGHRARIEGDLALRTVRIAGTLILRGVEITRDLSLTLATINGDVECFPDANGLPVEIGGTVGLWSATIAGQASFSGARIKGHFTATSLKAQGVVVLRGTQITGNATFTNATIRGDLECRPDVSGQPLQVGGNVWLWSARLSSQANFSGARIKGDFDASTVTIEDSLLLSGAQIEGAVKLANATLRRDLECRPTATGQQLDIGGEFSLWSAHIHGQLICSGARVRGRVVADYVRVEGNVYLDVAHNRQRGQVALEPVGGGEAPRSWDYSTEVHGDLSLIAARITGAVFLSGLKVGGNLALQYAHTGDNIHCDVPSYGTPAEIHGGLNLTGIQCAKNVDLDALQIRGDLIANMAKVERLSLGYGPANKKALRLVVGGQVEIQGTRASFLEFDGRLAGDKPLDLRDTEVTIVRIDGALPRRLNLHGFRFKELGAVPRNDYYGLLAATDPFATSTYVQVEKWLRERGDDASADEVYLRMRRRAFRDPGPRPAWTFLGMLFGLVTFSWLRRLGAAIFELIFLDLAVGYGTRSLRLGGFIAVLVAASTVLFYWGPALEPAVTPAAAQVAAESAARKPAPLDAFWVALQTNLPVVRLPAAEEWKVTDRPLFQVGGVGLRYIDWASFFSFLSWITVPLFVASFSGLIKKKG